jgi:predicted neuraminidase
MAGTTVKSIIRISRNDLNQDQSVSFKFSDSKQHHFPFVPPDFTLTGNKNDMICSKNGLPDGKIDRHYQHAGYRITSINSW